MKNLWTLFFIGVFSINLTAQEKTTLITYGFKFDFPEQTFTKYHNEYLYFKDYGVIYVSNKKSNFDYFFNPGLYLKIHKDRFHYTTEGYLYLNRYKIGDINVTRIDKNGDALTNDYVLANSTSCILLGQRISYGFFTKHAVKIGCSFGADYDLIDLGKDDNIVNSVCYKIGDAVVNQPNVPSGKIYVNVNITNQYSLGKIILNSSLDVDLRAVQISLGVDYRNGDWLTKKNKQPLFVSSYTYKLTSSIPIGYIYK